MRETAAESAYNRLRERRCKLIYRLKDLQDLQVVVVELQDHFLASRRRIGFGWKTIALNWWSVNHSLVDFKYFEGGGERDFRWNKFCKLDKC